MDNHYMDNHHWINGFHHCSCLLAISKAHPNLFGGISQLESSDFSGQVSLSEISEGIWGLSENIIWVPLKLMSSHLLAYEHYIPKATWGTGSTFVPKN